jgi:hypothetical protein
MRKVFRFTWLLLPAGCIYLGWVFYSRWSDNHALIQRLEDSKAARHRAVVEAYGGDRLTILDFYAAPGTIHRGGKTQLCYSVSNSKSVRIEPPVENVWPSLDRCVEVHPIADTAYRLIAEDANGHTATASVMVKVH